MDRVWAGMGLGNKVWTSSPILLINSASRKLYISEMSTAKINSRIRMALWKFFAPQTCVFRYFSSFESKIPCKSPPSEELVFGVPVQETVVAKKPYSKTNLVY